MDRRLRRLWGATLCAALLVPGPALAQEPVTPESANSARFGVEQEGKQLTDTGAFDQAAELYWVSGVELKDPVLFIDAAEALRDKAAAERSIEAAQAALERVAPALDMLYFLRDSATSADWQPIAPEYVATVIERAEGLVRDAEALIAEIEAEQREADEGEGEPVEEESERGPAKPGTGLIAGGAAGLVIGVGGLALGVTGLGLGAQAQAQVEDPLVYAREHRTAEIAGKNANVMAGVGLAIGGLGVVVGAALLVVGLKKRKAAGGKAEPEPESEVGIEASVAPLWLEGGAGLGVSGRF